MTLAVNQTVLQSNLNFIYSFGIKFNVSPKGREVTCNILRDGREQHDRVYCSDFPLRQVIISTRGLRSQVDGWSNKGEIMFVRKWEMIVFQGMNQN